MADLAALQVLMSWLSPAFPVGGFAYSSGLETAIAEKEVGGRETLEDWLSGSLGVGPAWSDAVLLANAYKRHRNPVGLEEVAALCLALNVSSERHAELCTMGNAFIEASAHWPGGDGGHLPRPCPYPVAVGALGAAKGLGLGDLLTAFLTSVMQAQISVAVRLIPIGQSEGLDCLVALGPLVAEAVAAAVKTSLDEIGGAGYGADIAGMRHETLETRIFRS